MNQSRMKKYDVYGVGNALTDITVEVSEDFFKEHGIEKGIMTLIDEPEQHRLMDIVKNKKNLVSAGGSAANTLITISQLGGTCAYSSLIARDPMGEAFLEDMEKNNIDVSQQPANRPQKPSGKCLVMVSPDAERTMNTFLGVNALFSPDHIDRQAISDASYLYMEGYLVADPKGTEALLQAKQHAVKHHTRVALTFSDPSIPQHFFGHLAEVVGEGVDLLFCNEKEALIYTRTNTVTDACENLKKITKSFVVTLGARGSLVYNGQSIAEIQPYETTVLDTTGAGDIFAGTFLYGITHGKPYVEAANMASEASALVVSHHGPRLQISQAQSILRKTTTRP